MPVVRFVHDRYNESIMLRTRLSTLPIIETEEVGFGPTYGKLKLRLIAPIAGSIAIPQPWTFIT